MKSKTIKEIVIEVLNILDSEQTQYIDPAEHIYDAIKVIKRHLNDDDLEFYISDFIHGLNSSVNLDIDGTLEKCIKKLQSLNNN